MVAVSPAECQRAAELRGRGEWQAGTGGQPIPRGSPYADFSGDDRSRIEGQCRYLVSEKNSSLHSTFASSYWAFVQWPVSTPSIGDHK